MGLVVELLPIFLSILKEAPAAIERVKEAWSVVTSKDPPTDAQQAEFDAALDEAHKALQDS